MGFNSGFKGLNKNSITLNALCVWMLVDSELCAEGRTVEVRGLCTIQLERAPF